MISDEHIRVLSECLLSESGPYPLRREWEESDINYCLKNIESDQKHLKQLSADNILSSTESKHCNLCGCKAENCEFPTDHEHKTVRHYQINEEQLVRSWSDRARELHTFRSLEEPRKNQSGHWTIKADFQGDNVLLHLFLSDATLQLSEIHETNLEFGVSFLPFEHSPDEEYVFNWTMLVDSAAQKEFERNFEDLIDEFGETISARIVSKDAVEGYEREVRSGMKKTFENIGFNTSRETTKCNGYRKYDIKPIKDDFVAFADPNNESLKIPISDDKRVDILFCRCDKAEESIHLHTFIEGKLQSSEDKEEIKKLMDSFEEKISEYRKIQDRRELVNWGTKVASALASVIPILFILDILTEQFKFESPFQGLSDGQFQAAAGIIGIIIILLIFLAILVPFFQGFRFEWEMDNFE